MAELFEIINTRSSIRGYQDKEIPTEILKQILEAGLKAPTARNEQEIHISVVKKGNAVLDELQKALNPNAGTTFYYDAPVVLFLSGSDDFGWSQVDAGICVENMHLAAKGAGLGSLIIGCVSGILNGEEKAEYNRKLAVPEGKSFVIAMALGYPAVTKEQHEYSFENQVTFVD